MCCGFWPKADGNYGFSVRYRPSHLGMARDVIEKLGVHSKPQAVKVAARSGLIEL
jgi:hypothetical protein